MLKSFYVLFFSAFVCFSCSEEGEFVVDPSSSNPNEPLTSIQNGGSFHILCNGPREGSPSTALLFTSTVYNTQGNTIKYYWNFGDKGLGFEDSIYHIYDHPGFYKVRCIVEDVLNEQVLQSDVCEFEVRIMKQ